MATLTKLPSADPKFACCVQISGVGQQYQDVFDDIIWGDYPWSDYNDEMKTLFFRTEELFQEFVNATAHLFNC